VHSLCTGAERAAPAEVAVDHSPRNERLIRQPSLAEVERIVACLEPLACAVDDGEELEAEALFERIQTLLAD
jgi:hypothetical protein